MSSFRDIKINCPDCNTEGSYTIWDSVNVDLNPEMKSKVMNGSLFEWTCPNCGKTFNAPYSFLYHDMTHNFMVQFDAERSHIIPFAEYLRALENKLDIRVIGLLATSYRKTHKRENILFDCLTKDKQLSFTVLEMPEKTWVFSEKKHFVSFDEYLQYAKQIEDVENKEDSTPASAVYSDIWDETLEFVSEGEKIRYKIIDKFSQLGHGESINPQEIFGNDMSIDEYMEFMKVAVQLSAPQLIQSKEELETAILAQESDPDASKMNQIAYAYMVGEVVEQDLEESTKWFMKAAEQNNAEALDRVGGAYLHGAGVKQDFAMAAAYYKKSIIADGYPDALLDLGLAYLKGEGVPKDENHGVSLMLRAAKQGNAAAQYNMGYIYRAGVVVDVDMEESLRWYHLSADQGYEQAVDFLNQYAEDETK